MGNLIQGDLVRHEQFGIGRLEEISGAGVSRECLVYFPGLDKSNSVSEDALTVFSFEEKAAYEMMKLAAYEVGREELPKIELGARWQGGEMILKPGDPKLATKSVPIETFFHKIVMVRDRLRVMEPGADPFEHFERGEVDLLALVVGQDPELDTGVVLEIDTHGGTSTRWVGRWGCRFSRAIQPDDA